MKLIESSWEGKPVLTVEYGKGEVGKPFSFGIAKARLIIANMATIKSFTEKYATETEPKLINEARAVFARMGYKIVKA